MHYDATLTRRAGHVLKRGVSFGANRLREVGWSFFHSPPRARVYSWDALVGNGFAGRRSRNRQFPVAPAPRVVRLHRMPAGASLDSAEVPLRDFPARFATPRPREARAVFDNEEVALGRVLRQKLCQVRNGHDPLDYPAAIVAQQASHKTGGEQ